MTKLPVIYVAGPFRAKTPWQVECNIRRAEAVGLEIARLGAVPLIPHTMYRFFNGEGSDEFWLGGTLELLRRCDALVLLVDWQGSAGSRGEKAEAALLDLPIHYMDASGTGFEDFVRGIRHG